jgi:Xaa-Pro dipeptidase
MTINYLERKKTPGAEKSIYETRRERLYEKMEADGIAVAMLSDSEHGRCPSIRYLCGHPSDALLFLDSLQKKCVLVAWDMNMAEQRADMDTLFPYTGYEMKDYVALMGVLQYLKTPQGARVDVPIATPYRDFLRLVEYGAGYDIICREDGFEKWVAEMRAVKDPVEIKIYEVLSNITNTLIDSVEDSVRKKSCKTEVNAAIMLEYATRVLDCEGLGFGTLCAGPKRSFAIHAFPGYTNGPFATEGLSIIDFGIVLEGYTSDVTMTFVRKPNKKQERLLTLVENAWQVAFNMLKNGAGEKGIPARDVALAVDAHFAKAKQKMPHGLGHGIGLEAHEAPYLRSAADNTWVLRENMIFTLEPGLYDKELGGVRLENDVLLEKDSAKILTKSRIVRL